MKTLVILTIVLLAGLASNAQKTTITLKDLPSAAQSFISSNFHDQQLTYAVKDSEPFDTDYEVMLKGGVKIEFDSQGNWEEIKSTGSTLQPTLLPSLAAAYLEENYKSQGILKIEKDRKGYEIELANGFELEFDIAGRFIRIDK